MDSVSKLHQQMIGVLMKKKSNQDIALLLDLPVDTVIQVVKEIAGYNPFEARTHNKKINKPARKQAPRAEVRHTNSVRKKQEPKFKTKEVNHSLRQHIRIDSKTIIEVDAGVDPVKAKEEYLKRVAIQKQPKPPAWKQVRKFS